MRTCEGPHLGPDDSLLLPVLVHQRYSIGDFGPTRSQHCFQRLCISANEMNSHFLIVFLFNGAELALDGARHVLC